jgi:hypothetical protein
MRRRRVRESSGGQKAGEFGRLKRDWRSLWPMNALSAEVAALGACVLAIWIIADWLTSLNGTAPPERLGDRPC